MQPNFVPPTAEQPFVQKPPKDWFVTLLLAIFLGGLGVHQFYTGKFGIGVLMLIAAGGCGIWWLIDIIMIATGAFTDSERRPLVRQV